LYKITLIDLRSGQKLLFRNVKTPKTVLKEGLIDLVREFIKNSHQDGEIGWLNIFGNVCKVYAGIETSRTHIQLQSFITGAMSEGQK
jgi:hypothetical protein